jgi:hypothetical protein
LGNLPEQYHNNYNFYQSPPSFETELPYLKLHLRHPYRLVRANVKEAAIQVLLFPAPMSIPAVDTSR